MTTRAINGAAVKVIREALGISQRDLAGRCAVSQGSLSNVERGINGASPELSRKVADAMGVPLESITYPVAAPEPVAAIS